MLRISERLNDLRLPALVVGLLLITNLAAQGDAQETARQILDASGVQGGLVVHLNVGDGTLTAALHATDGYTVQGLDTDAAAVDQAREHVRSLGLYGQVSVDRLIGTQLPFIENLINLLVTDDLGDVPMDEVMRVLTPGGVAYIKQAGQWNKTIKPIPDEIDEWTHYLHNPTNNAVSQDSVVDLPRRYQWVGSPRYSRHHDHMSSVSAVVSSGGRIFTIFDEAPRDSIETPADWWLIARDAFNGTILWKRPMATWHSTYWPLKSGPSQLPRRLVSIGDVVYVTMGIDSPLTALNAATGETIRTYDNTTSTDEILLDDGTLYVLVNQNGKNPGDWDTDKPTIGEVKAQARAVPWSEHAREIVAIDALSGKEAWRIASDILPLTLTVDDTNIYYHDGQSIVCLDRADGSKEWNSPPVERRGFLRSFFAPTLVAYDGVLLFSGGSVANPNSKKMPRDADSGGGSNTMFALSAEDGKILWNAPHPPSGYKSPEDILVAGGLVWFGETTSGGSKGMMTGRNPQTGEIVREFPPDVDTYWFHHRCYRGKATEKYLLMSRTGIEFIDHEEEHWEINHFVRGACLYGILPANGLVYAPQHPCACYLESKLSGFTALAPVGSTNSGGRGIDQPGVLEKGPAYGLTSSSTASAEDWPTYRHDALRSGSASTEVPEALMPAWRTQIGGRLTAPVVADGVLYVAQIDEHLLHAIDTTSGKTLWTFTTGGRIDSPPTIASGLVLFGCNDGWVYCLTPSGQLAWRYQAAPNDQRMVAYEQIESVWPVHGSVLIQDGAVYCVAGRSSFLDGGLRVLKLDPVTGEKLHETLLDETDDTTGENLHATVDWLNMTTGLPDILSSDGNYIYMRSMPLNKKGERLRHDYEDLSFSKEGDDFHLFCPTGFLDEDIWHRSYWVYGRGFLSGWSAYYLNGQRMPAGRPMVFNDDAVYGFGRQPQYYKWTTPIEYFLYSAEKRPDVVVQTPRKPNQQKRRAPDPANRRRHTIVNLDNSPMPGATTFATNWSNQIAVQARAMVLAGDTLFVSGVEDLVDEEEAQQKISSPEMQLTLIEQDKAFRNLRGGLLWVISTQDGETLHKYRLDSLPVFDGMAAAQGRLYVATKNGDIICLGGE